MPNKQITDLDPLVGGMDDTYNFWTQVDGGGPGSSFQMAWSKLFLAKNVAVGNGTAMIIRAGNGGGAGSYGGASYLYAGDGVGFGGDARIIAGDASVGYAGDARMIAGNGGSAGGDVHIQPGSGGDYGGNVNIALMSTGAYRGQFIIQSLPTSNPGGSNYVWRDAGTLKIT